MSDDGQPAFPGPAQSSLKHDHHEGMSLRDYFAASAMIGLLPGAHGKKTSTVAFEAYVLADCMLAERVSPTHAAVQATTGDDYEKEGA